MMKKKTDSGKILPHSSSTQDYVMLPVYNDDTPERREREFIFRSPAMREIHMIATQVAGSDASILVYGESGTGKELFARLIHMLSGRGERPFIAMNCGVLQGELFADKFFGHEAGAYTGANHRHKGAFEAAETGTLFLDEVGEIPSTNQVDFLRVLEERSFCRMGGSQEIPFQARIIAATNRPLMQMVQEGSFRADLFYRLNVVPVCLPPLRVRKEDIALLAEHLLSLFRHQYHRHDIILHEDVLEIFNEYPWPGNVRELRNLMERLVLLAQNSCITAKCLPLEMHLAVVRPGASSLLFEPETEVFADPTNFTLATAVQEAEICAIVRAYKQAGGHKGKTAELLGISSRSLRYKFAEYHLGL